MTNTTGWKMNAQNRTFIASFSGGKDSVLALYKASQVGQAMGLIVMLEEEGKRSRSHGMPPALIQAQADSIGLPVYTAAASWADYEEVFVGLLVNAKQQGAEVLVTGDLDMPAHGCWHDKVTKKVGLKLGMPLWEMNHREAVDEFIHLGFITMIVTVNLSLGMTEDDLGRVLTPEYVKELEARSIDPCGEGGEFHTTVIDGPLFKQSIAVRKGSVIRDGDYAFLPLELA
ncbi:diphthine--ammonia ligase [Lysinibacillus sp. OL1_EC]|uniref:Dph6-related ATP pyrophosphatase n=1 Tax=unclassified Lysinibacillus TaxID=2636778 RepID=UPI00103F011C|nr:MULTISPECIES: diphthine--ammonia ligase [unclassified Lysinibacillus]MCM0623864.1 diphthine--ammonia ligase [Lysinibacillus sp. OL1_EC]MCS5503123.1 diphthine--ammonia ligase [Lysinibacillus sp. A4]TBV88960.1 diphthine--ammonia ligase [Lysinibacillus sp. OL1]UKJ47521.1 diphthine--ammonia ligase [Lysinibacillus sp. ACHW1.5]